MSEQEIIDDAPLQMIRDAGGDEFLVELIDIFIETSAERIAEVKSGISAGDWGQIQSNIHSIIGPSGNIGATTLLELCRRIEQHADDQELDEISELIAPLETLFLAVKERLLQIKASSM